MSLSNCHHTLDRLVVSRSRASSVYLRFLRKDCVLQQLHLPLTLGLRKRERSRFQIKNGENAWQMNSETKPTCSKISTLLGGSACLKGVSGNVTWTEKSCWLVLVCLWWPVIYVVQRDVVLFSPPAFINWMENDCQNKWCSWITVETANTNHNDHTYNLTLLKKKVSTKTLTEWQLSVFCLGLFCFPDCYTESKRHIWTTNRNNVPKLNDNFLESCNMKIIIGEGKKWS